MEHDKLATRLSLIIYKLNQGERLTIESLANEFGVSKRTIERDMARFSYFDIKKEGKEFFLDEIAVGKLNFDNIKNFAIFSGIKSLFPSLTNQFLKDILNDKINRAYLWKLLLSTYFIKYTETLPDRASIPKLNKKELVEFSFPLPPIELQNKFASIVEKCETIKEKENQKLKQLENLHNSLMQKAFKGEIH